VCPTKAAATASWPLLSGAPKLLVTLTTPGSPSAVCSAWARSTSELELASTTVIGQEGQPVLTIARSSDVSVAQPESAAGRPAEPSWPTTLRQPGPHAGRP
jgi:hypothetical protein